MIVVVCLYIYIYIYIYIYSMIIGSLSGLLIQEILILSVKHCIIYAYKDMLLN